MRRQMRKLWIGRPRKKSAVRFPMPKRPIGACCCGTKGIMWLKASVKPVKSGRTSIMKMENSIMILADATIKKINVSSGQAVEEGQVLVELA